MARSKVPHNWEKYRVTHWNQAALENAGFRKDTAEYYKQFGCDIRHDTIDNFLADLASEQIPVSFK